MANKAAKLAAKLNQLDVASGMKELEKWYDGALHFNVIDDATCIMHADGSANIVEHIGKGRVTVEVLSAGQILMVLEHYRPFTEVFKQPVQ